MTELEKLRKQMELIIKRLEDLNASVRTGDKVRAFTEEEQGRYDASKAELEQVRSAIKREDELEEARAESDRLSKVSSTRVELVRSENHDKDGNYRGFKEVGKGGLGDFLQCVAKRARGEGEDKRLVELRAATGMNEGIGADGGFFLQPDHAVDLFSSVVDTSEIAKRCTKVPMSSNSTTTLMLDETSLAKGSIYGGVRAYWRGEAGTVTASRPKFREVNVKADALEALCYVTEEQLEDSSQLETEMNLAFNDAMALELNDAILNGNGAGKPLGILNSACLITIAKESGQTADTVNYANIDNMADRVLTQAKPGAIWLCHPDVLKQLRGAVYTPASKTDFLPLMPSGGVSGAQYATLFGKPLIEAQACSALGDKGDIIQANFKYYKLYIRKGVTASQSMHVAFLTGERVFKWTMRAAGMSMFNSAITDQHGSTTRSPFVTLAARA